MNNARTDTRWRAIQGWVKGASHIRSGKPNQDRIKFSDRPSEIFPLVLAVADGHGSKSYFRSDKGAEFAVESGIEVSKKLGIETWDSIKDKKFFEALCREIVQKWLEKVIADIQMNTFTPEEKLLLLTKKETSPKRPGIFQNENVIAYGSTLIIAVVHESFILYLQLGDGDILLVSSHGDVDRPLPKDERLFGNETTSLCLPESWSDFRYRLYPIDHLSPAPALILLSTDGYANSFIKDSEFEKVGVDLLDIICENEEGFLSGIDYIQKNIDTWLDIASNKGSGDDTTVGILCNLDQIEKYFEENYAENHTKKVRPSEKSDDPSCKMQNENPEKNVPALHSTEVIINDSPEESLNENSKSPLSTNMKLEMNKS